MKKFQILILGVIISTLTACFGPPHSTFKFNNKVDFKDKKIAIKPVLPTFEYDGSCISKEDLQVFGSHFAEDLSQALKLIMKKNNMGFEKIEVVNTGRIESCPCEYTVTYYNGQQAQPITIYDREKKIVECSGTINANKIFSNAPALLDEHQLNFQEYAKQYDYVIILIPIKYWVVHIPLMETISYQFIYAMYETKSGKMLGIGHRLSDYCENFSECHEKMAKQIVEEIHEALNPN